MKIGLVVTKNTPAGYVLIGSCAEVLKKLGIQITIISNNKEAQRIDLLDLVVQVCWFSPNVTKSHQSSLRYIVLEKCQKFRKNILVFDASFTGHKHYYAVSINGIKGYGTYLGNHEDDLRWKKLDLNLSDYRKTGRYIVILGQTRYGTSTYDINVFDEYDEAIRKLLKVSKYAILFRHHPKVFKKRAEIYKNSHIQFAHHEPLEQVLKNTYAAVYYNTNASIFALIYGIPIFSLSQSGIAFEVSNKNLNNINSPKYFDRELFFNKIAYWQWSLDEIKDGTFWKYILKYEDELCNFIK